MKTSPPSHEITDPETKRQDTRLYDRNFLLAMASQTSFVIANTLTAHYARWIEFLGGDLRQVGWIMGTGALLGLILRPWLGQWINRFGPRRMWLIGFGTHAVGCIGNLIQYDLGVGIYFLRTCLVFGSAIVFSSGLTYASQAAPANRRTEAIGILGVGGFIGMLIGPVLGDLFLGADERDRAAFGSLFISAGLANIFPVLMICMIKAPKHQNPKSRTRLRDFLSTCKEHWPGMILLIDLAFGVCMTIPFGFLASYIDQEKLIIPGVSVFGLYFWCYAGWGLTVRVVSRRVPEMFGRRKVLLVGTFFMSIGMFCFFLVDSANPWKIMIPALITGTGHGLMFHTMTSLTIENFPIESRGTGSALSLMMLDLGTFVGSPILGEIAEVYGFAWLFIAVGGFCLFSGVLYLWSSIPVWKSRSQS